MSYTNYSDREKKKRNRSTNFTDQETRLLTGLVPKQLHVIESKQMDGNAWRAKAGAWDQLCEEFNLKSGTIMRTPNQLRSKYESMKGVLKRKIFKNRQEMYKTSGSPPHIVPLTDYEERLFSLTFSSCAAGSKATTSTDNNQDHESIPGSSVDPLNMVTIAETFKISPDTEEDQPGTSQEIYESTITSDAEPSTWAPTKISTFSLPSERVSSTQNRNKKKDYKEKFYTLIDARAELMDLQVQTAKSELKLKERQLEMLDEEKLRAVEKHEKEMEIINRELRRKIEEQSQETERHLKQMELLELEKQLCLGKLNNKIS